VRGHSSGTQDNTYPPNCMSKGQKDIQALVSGIKLDNNDNYMKAVTEFRKMVNNSDLKLSNDCKIFLLHAICAEMHAVNRLFDAENELREIISSCDKLTWVWLGELNFTKATKFKAGMLEELCILDEKNNYRNEESAHLTLLEYIKAANASGNPIHIANSNYNTGSFERRTLHYADAIIHFDAALKVYLEDNRLPYAVDTLVALSDIYRILKKYADAVRSAEQAYIYAEKAEDCRLMRRSAKQCATAYSYINDTEHVKYYCQNILSYCQAERRGQDGNHDDIDEDWKFALKKLNIVSLS